MNCPCTAENVRQFCGTVLHRIVKSWSRGKKRKEKTSDYEERCET